MINLNKIKNTLIKEYDLHPSESVPSFNIDKISDLMLKNQDIVQQISDSIGEGEDFRCYFSDIECMKKYIQMFDENKDEFYRILRKEELFLNKCLQAFGYKNAVIQFDPKLLLENMKHIIDDEDDFEL